ncbi:hypothetical protein FHS61_001301 [Altererythrobacter atlanticus]|uniref:Uncharacterized protein n=1 Tax=Croceibacterium atlanticum TaxID=1267766 RepID=A0A0F7KXM3_9SPHN|nr:hypothetical protein [Croceibacterium atlanticum]AKH43986.1 hypothetical protein WYH_02960 [Croceibacterium atlanticum]MBB5732292.1 hypothetical protein [Croceibacterium atlanticum]
MRIALGIGAAALAFAASGLVAQTVADDGALRIRAVMQDAVNPAILTIWDVGNNAMSDDGGIDPELMTDESWDRLAHASAELVEASRMIAAADKISAAAPDNMGTAEGEISMEDVQRYIDNDTDGLRELALEQAAHAEKLLAAARAKDAATAGDLVAGMDLVCESCHARYWYPEG